MKAHDAALETFNKIAYGKDTDEEEVDGSDEEDRFFLFPRTPRTPEEQAAIDALRAARRSERENQRFECVLEGRWFC